MTQKNDSDSAGTASSGRLFQLRSDDDDDDDDDPCVCEHFNTVFVK